MTAAKPSVSGVSGRRLGDFLLFGVTSVEFVLLFLLTSTFTLVDWIYVLQHLLVLGIALTRRPPEVRDHSLPASAAVVIAYAYPYAQVVYLRWATRRTCVARRWTHPRDARGISEHCEPPQPGQTVRGLPGLAGPDDKRSLSARAPSDVSGLRDCRHRVQPPGMECRHSASRDGGVGISALPHSRRRADTLSRCRMVCLRCLSAPPPHPRPLVGSVETVSSKLRLKFKELEIDYLFFFISVTISCTSTSFNHWLRSLV